MSERQPRFPLSLILGGLVLLLLGVAGGWAFESHRSGTADDEAFGHRVREYLLAHPEVLPEAMEHYRQNESRKQLSGVGDKLEAAFPGAVLGNPQGKTVLVEFTDFACTYCRGSVADVDALIAANPDLKVVVRELPIIAPTSPEAARWGLAAAQQGKYSAFHHAMFAIGRTDQASIEAAAREAGLDLERARRFVADPAANRELAANLDYAKQLGIDGTPSWVIGDQLLKGAVGKDMLAKAIAETHGS